MQRAGTAPGESPRAAAWFARVTRTLAGQLTPLRAETHCHCQVLPLILLGHCGTGKQPKGPGALNSRLYAQCPTASPVSLRMMVGQGRK